MTLAKGETGSAAPKTPSIALVGDSLAEGLGPPFAALAPCAFRALGKSSTRVRDWLRGSALDEAVGVPPAALVLVCLGTNDMRTADPAGAGSAGGALIDRLVAAGASVAWIGPPRMSFDNGTFRAALARECGARSVRIFDSQALDLERAPDGIHLTPRGYRTWAEAIAAWVPFSAYASRGAAAGGAAPVAGAAPALLTLRAQLDARWPRRSRASDGIAPSDEHRRANPKSEHATGDAIDITHDPDHGPDLGALADALLKDQRTRYVIWRRRIANAQKEGGAWRPYTGASPHEDHLHLSILAGRREDASAWELAAGAEGAAPGAPSAPALRMPASVHVDGFGVLGLEDYVARVVTAELGAARQLQALAAQAMAARSYVVWMMANQGYGTPAKPVPNSPRFQVCARTATALCIQATAATRGGLVLHGGRLVLTSYVAGALWAQGASSGRNGADPSKTEHAVTYNEGLVGAAVKPTPNAGKIADNRGCLSQNGAVELGRRGYLWPAILRCFYGADIEFTCPAPRLAEPPPRRPDVPRPDAPRVASPPAKPPPPASGQGSQEGGPLLIAAAVAAYRIFT